jgi:serine/threonine protein kinase/predicted Zn-dependent protease
MTERDLFEAALDLPSENRAGYLAGVCGDDAALRQRLEGLLNKHGRAGGFLEQPAGSSVATVAERSISEEPGTLIGNYKLLEQIGEGGFGVVFMAEQRHPVHRKVALKVVKPGMDTRQVIARFEAERQALALMDHPNIASVFDGGETAGGRPYFVMELVRGIPITDFCNQGCLTIDERLELFLNVCQAMQHAHQKGIIHRDLKPSNVLVTLQDGAPLVKVIDFGIAKALGQRLTDKTVFTGFAQMIGTPLYMSPEQAALSNVDVDTRSDVYSLGVLLYDLLTGTTPFEEERFKDAGYDEIRHIIREEEPPRPSVRISTLGETATLLSSQRRSEPRRLSHLCRGELDWIVMKCLDKDRNRRYETTSALAADVRSYLNDERVQACPPSAWYKFRKFARRQKRALAMAACLLLALAGMAGGMGWAARDRLAREEALDLAVERTLAETGPLIEKGNWPEALTMVQQADKLLASAGRTARPPRLLQLGKELSMADRLEDICREPNRRTYPMVSGGEGAEPKAQADSSDAQQAARIACAFREFGIDVEVLDPAQAAERISRTTIRQALIKALDQWAIMCQRDPGSENSLWKKLVEIARQSDPDLRRNQFRQALLKRDRAALEKLAEDVLAGAVPPPATVYLLAHVLRGLGAGDKAMAVLRKAYWVHPEDFWLNEALGSFSRNDYHRYDDALHYYRVAIALRPRNLRMHLEVADLWLQKGAMDEAIAAYSRMVELAPGNEWGFRSRAVAYHRSHQYENAIADYKKAIDLHTGHGWVAASLGMLLLHHKHDERGAIESFRKAIELDPNLVKAYQYLGWLLVKHKHDYEGAIPCFRKAIDLDPRDAWSHRCLCRAYVTLGQWAKAAAAYTPWLELNPDDRMSWYMAAALRLHTGDVPGYRQACGEMLTRFGKTGATVDAEQTAKTCLLAPEAVNDFEAVRKLADLAATKNSSDRWILLTKALAEYRAGQWSTAVKWLQRVAPKDAGDSLDSTAFALLAMAQQRQGHSREARASLDQAQAILAHKLPKPERQERYGGDWHNWLRNQILCREAESLLGSKDKKTSDRDTLEEASD